MAWAGRFLAFGKPLSFDCERIEKTNKTNLVRVLALSVGGVDNKIQSTRPSIRTSIDDPTIESLLFKLQELSSNPSR